MVSISCRIDMRIRAYRASVLVLAFAAFFLGIGCDGDPTGVTGGGDEVILAVGTTVQDSGLLDVIVPAFEEATDYRIIAVPVGTGEALEMGRRGDADVLLVHSPSAEEEFVLEGYGVDRQLVMYNDFIIVGPADDPAGIARVENAVTALHGIRKSEAPFISRGDDSGTHKLELKLWDELGFDPTGEDWYSESGQGMGQTLQIANQQGAYTISDRGTYLALQDNVDLEIIFEGDPMLLNVYHVMQVNPEKFDSVNADGAAAFVDFMISDAMQAIIGEFGLEEYGRPLFIPAAGKSEDELEVWGSLAEAPWPAGGAR